MPLMHSVSITCLIHPKHLDVLIKIEPGLINSKFI